ncbi:hypothetical protein PVAP13_3NG303918 [Panicum virgatum]|uniref:Uncharacterized protein n=1 Tax=Panicum virgatum TaxID=38727 RepID=A0A8T0UMM1_PANVG|nr:hypothetical protein PVAP13_3NG303918 [Panicum virgatum]
MSSGHGKPDRSSYISSVFQPALSLIWRHSVCSAPPSGMLTITSAPSFPSLRCCALPRRLGCFEVCWGVLW